MQLKMVSDCNISLVDTNQVFDISVVSLYHISCKITVGYTLCQSWATGEGCDLHRLISLMFRPFACQLSAVVPFRLLVLRSGTAYQTMSPPLRPCQPSGAI